jgi:ankyrin repeat protein
MVDARNIQQWTPLNFACHNYSRRTSIDQVQLVATLLDHQADIEHCDNRGDSPLISALRGRLTQVVWLLIQRGANVFATTRFGHSSLLLSIQPQYRPCIRTRSPDYQLAMYLLEHGVDGDSATRTGVTPLHAAVNGGHVAVAALLLAHGAKVDTRDHNEHTPLQCVLDYGHCINNLLPLVRLLLSYNANVHLTNASGTTLLEQATFDSSVWALVHHHLTTRGQLAFVEGLHHRLGQVSSLYTDFACHPLFDRNLVPLIWGWYSETQG